MELKVDDNGVAKIVATYSADDRCATILVDYLRDERVRVFKVINMKRNRFYLVDRLQLIELYKMGQVVPFKLPTGKEVILEHYSRFNKDRGYGAYFTERHVHSK